MKGKNTFTQSEISELRNLVKERIKADRTRQKGIRAKMRRIGFYGSDDFGITDLQPSDFDQLISSGTIRVLGHGTIQRKAPPVELKPKTSTQASNLHPSKDFTLFDPKEHTSDCIPDKPGNYIVCLKDGSELPDIGIPYEMKTYQGLNVIYTGIAGNSLRKRDYRQHFTGNNAGTSTLRKSIGSMFGYAKIPRDKDPSNGKTKFQERDETKLSEWMHSNLVLYFRSNFLPNDLENELIRELNPPLNLSKNFNVINLEFRKKLSELRCLK